MKRLYIILTVALFCTLMASCQKQDPATPDNSDEETSIMDLHDCATIGLVHHEATEPGISTWGNIEYWECPFCSRRYSDNAAKNEITGNVMLQPLSKTAIPDSILSIANDRINFHEERGIAGTKSAASTILLLCDKIVGLAFNIATPDIDSTTAALEEIYADLEEVEAALEEVSYKEDQIIESLSHLSETIESITTQQRCVEERYNDIVTLKNGVGPLFKTIYQRYEMMQEPDADIESQLDFMRKDIKSWAEDTKGLMLTQSLMGSFPWPLATKVGLTFPKVLANYTDYFCNWADEGYDYRTQVLLMDRFYLSIAYTLSQSYYSQCKEWNSQESKNTHISATETLLDNYITCYEADLEDRIYDEDTYNIFIREGIRYYTLRNLKGPDTYSVYQWAYDHLRINCDRGYYRYGTNDATYVNNNTAVWNDIIKYASGLFGNKVIHSDLYDLMYATRSEDITTVESWLDQRYTSRSSRKLFVPAVNRSYCGNGDKGLGNGGNGASATYGDVYHNESWRNHGGTTYPIVRLGIIVHTGSGTSWSECCYGCFETYGTHFYRHYEGMVEDMYLEYSNPATCYIYLEKQENI